MSKIRLPRKQKKALKNKHGENWVFYSNMKAVRRMLSYPDMRILSTFLKKEENE